MSSQRRPEAWGSGCGQGCFLRRPWGVCWGLSWLRGFRLCRSVPEAASLCLVLLAPGVASGPTRVRHRVIPAARLHRPSFPIRSQAEVLADVDLGGHVPPRMGGIGLCESPPQPQTRLQKVVAGAWSLGHLGAVYGAQVSAPGPGAPTACLLHGEDPDLGLTPLGSTPFVSQPTASMCPAP